VAKKKNTAKPVKAWTEALTAGSAPADAPEGWAVATEWLADGSGSLESLDGRLALSAVSAAGATKAVARLQALDNSPDKDLRKAARRALHSLRSTGVEIVDTPKATRFSLAAEVLDIPSRAFLGHAHQEGYAPFLLTATDAEGSCILAGEIGGTQGVRNTTHLHVTRRDLREIWKDAEGNADLTEVTFVTGMHFVKRGMGSAKSLSGQSPHDWEHFLGHISQGTQTAAQLLDPADGLPTELDEPALGALDEGKLLAEREWFRFWPLPEDAINALFEDLSTAAMASELVPTDEAQPEHQEEAFEKAADEALADTAVRTRWAEYLRISVAVLLAQGEDAKATEVHNLGLALAAGLPGRKLAPVLASLRFQTFKMASMMGGMEPPPAT
jgi:hypothetical protein